MSHAHAETPEFRIVVKRPGRGPLAPYRLTIAILFTMAVSGPQLWSAAQTGMYVDGALIRAAVAGLFAWLVVGRANKILKNATPPPSSAESADDDRRHGADTETPAAA